MSSQTQPIIGANFQNVQVFRLVGPTVTVDASGGLVTVNSNAKFNTNLPLDRYALITKITYFVTWTKLPVSEPDNLASWNLFAQLTEALARTSPVATDPVYVDEWTLHIRKSFVTSGAEILTFPGTLDRVLYNPWATAAQQLNFVVAAQPNNSGANGPNAAVSPVLEYQLLPLTTDIRTYLATRVQIAGQA